MYTFEQLKKDLLAGREIEFKYNGNLYSLTNSFEGWALCINSELIGHHFKDINHLITFIAQVKIDGVYLKELIDLNKYEQNTLYIL